jgi:hypothetical protein
LKNARWEETSSGIAISEDKAYLIDGQHRLTGQELSKTSVPWTVHLLSQEAERAIDVGRNRSLAVVTAIDASIVASCRNMNEHFLRYTGPSSPGVMQEIYAKYKPSMDLVIGHKQIKGAAVWGTFAYCHGQLADFPTLQKRLEGFIDSVAKGLMLQDTDPAFILREWLITTKQSNAKDRWEIYHRIIRACYIHVQNRKGVTMEEIERWFHERNPENTEVFSGYLEIA